jgi:ribosome-associated translation inhibitor RaiA
MADNPDVATVDQSLRLGGGVENSERETIVHRWSKLDHRLRSFPADAVELQLTVKERDTPSQRTTLEAWIAGQPRLVATSNEESFERALNEVRDDLIRQLTDAKNRSEPRNNPNLRATD